jgi:hypothetical protein
LLRHPGAFQKLVEAVACLLWQKDEAGRVVEIHCAMHLPPGVLQEWLAVREQVMALALALRPIAYVMCADHAKRACHANQRAQVDQQVFQPLRRVEALVNQQSVHADGVTCAQGDGACHDEQGKRFP